jgi:TonB-linked SusC/RagA family outer membrane protein
MKRLLTTLLLFLGVVGMAIAQRTVTGKVSGDDGEALIGATITVKGAAGGTRTNVTGDYTLQVPAGATTLVFSYTGYATQEITLGASNSVNVTLASGVQLTETVVTAMGVSRYKNELPYSAQKVEGEDVTRTRENNLISSLGGKVAGLEVRRNNGLGASTNIVLRGTKSLTGNNQALFVVDGVPVDNSNSNTTNQKTGRGGYDYGNPADDINPDDIESVTVLKGAAASALYGSRASNGVVMINTKKGRANKGLGVSVNLGLNTGTYDPSTFAKYQNKYGGGYGQYYEDPSGYFLSRDINGDGVADLVVPTSEDASWGHKFDPSLQVYQWDAFDPTSPYYKKSKPWVAATNGPSALFERTVGTNNSVFIDGSNEKGYFKLGYTRASDKGLLPNSQINKDMVDFGGGLNLTDRLKMFAAINYTSTDGLGRYGTGYDAKNLMTNVRQWWEVNTDVLEQKDAYFRGKQNVTWNWADPTSLVPIYWDNPYWTRYQNYESDHRNRYFGNFGASWKVTNWFDVTARMSLDQYDEIQEERIAIGSIDVPIYSRFNRVFREINYDVLGQTKQFNLIGEKLKFDALIGMNIRKQDYSTILATTNGGLSVPNVYSLSNSANALNAPVEVLNQRQVNGIFGKAGFVYDGWAILDLTMRGDRSSTLPVNNNTYYYPSASLGIIFSNWLKDSKAISFGKLRFNYAQVGNDAPPHSTLDVFNLEAPYNGVALASATSTNANSAATNTKNNSNLKPESTQGWETGLEMRFLRDMFGFDATYYDQKTIDQILPVATSRATGYSAKYINAGSVENKGIELSLFIRPVHSRDWDWRVDLNWARNRNKVVALSEGIDNLQLASFQGGVSINAALGQAYGTIRGDNFVYLNGQKVVASTGYYQRSATSNEVIGNVNADWTGSVSTSLRYKHFTLSGLVDVRQGGQVFSLDLYYGLATGLYPETAVLNDKGNEVRAALADGGGLIVPGVLADGTANTKRVSAANFGIYGYRRNPAAAFVYDASYIKLREVNLAYDLPTAWLGSSVKGISVGVYGRNLWIIHKNLPYADPEDGISAGNVQGYQVGAVPSVRTIGVNLHLKF